MICGYLATFIWVAVQRNARSISVLGRFCSRLGDVYRDLLQEGSAYEGPGSITTSVLPTPAFARSQNDASRPPNVPAQSIKSSQEK